MGRGVEWAVHCCLNLVWIGPEEAVTVTRLAAFYDLPVAYLNKQIQALVRGGIASSVPGRRGGFRLARPPERISLLDIVTAIEGPEPAFRCAEIRQQGPFGDERESVTGHCLVDQAMRRAELAWRRELAAQTLAGLTEAVERDAPGVPERARRWFSSHT
ncbi:BadM/Rrf2 family transcriptional regulator [Pseudonocardia hierapolitana]|uniref:BadM/Rrf2 family transcriptional regulator n=1 Tax=Pseudonocardia hierapolitana TaxID=1128676 RepID=A0A561SQ25_9PSEU|nr:Rrf2 family transcriptional regulator [Pseudonocardia hierapolitana]TWF76965.1 BadM/Rrf2 family transcriptional regulator [Pseudonocardia hierapolitana]